MIYLLRYAPQAIRDNYIEVVRVIMAKGDYMTMIFGETDENLDSDMNEL